MPAASTSRKAALPIGIKGGKLSLQSMVMRILGLSESLSCAHIYVNLSDAQKRPVDTENGFSGHD
jgi:hypothetical protein